MEYGLIGEYLGHSYSPEIHAKIGDYAYTLQELTPAEVGPFLEKKDFLGINVTIPYKETVLPYLDDISPAARLIGAVNTIVNRKGKLYGDNTDFFGMQELFRHGGINPQGKYALILGTGGTAKTAHAVLKSLGAKSIVHVSRQAQSGAVTYAEAPVLQKDAQIIVNTTPVGMYPAVEGCPLDLSLFPEVEGVVDAVYTPLRTNLVLDAQAKGILAEGGLYMLAAQAVAAASLFQNQPLDQSRMETAYAQVWREKVNIVLLGMPSAGKTTVGKALAKLSGKAFIDTDQLIVERLGCSIGEYFAQAGEEAFRQVEAEVVAEAAKERGAVIATGGGVVLRPENLRALQRNGKTVFLDRPLEKLLPTPDRPLALNREALTQRYQERYPLYCQAGEWHVPSVQEPKVVAETIWKEIAP